MIYSASKWKKYQIEDLQNTLSLQSEKNEVIFFIFPPIWLHFPKVENISSIPFISTKLKKSYVYFSFPYTNFFHFSEVDYILYQCGLFPGSFKYFTNALYFLEVHKCFIWISLLPNSKKCNRPEPEYL